MTTALKRAVSVLLLVSILFSLPVFAFASKDTETEIESTLINEEQLF